MSFDRLPYITTDDNSLINIQFKLIDLTMSELEVIGGRRLKAGDTAQDFEAELIKENGRTLEIPDGATVIFGARLVDFDSTVDSTEYLTSGYSGDFENYAEGEVVDAANGIVAFDWSDADTTDQVGTYDAEIKLIWTDDDSDESVESFPSKGFTEVTIRESL